jgi:hypothetical protein
VAVVQLLLRLIPERLVEVAAVRHITLEQVLHLPVVQLLHLVKVMPVVRVKLTQQLTERPVAVVEQTLWVLMEAQTEQTNQVQVAMAQAHIHHGVQLLQPDKTFPELSIMPVAVAVEIIQTLILQVVTVVAAKVQKMLLEPVRAESHKLVAVAVAVDTHQALAQTAVQAAVEL